ncbi:MAG: YceK/YidQ family lipoprotein, partial [Pseudomonas sp.]
PEADLPASMLLDTLLLPITLPTALGFNVQTRGGL